MKRHFLSDDDFMLRYENSSWNWGRSLDYSSQPYKMTASESNLYQNCGLVRFADYTAARDYGALFVDRSIKQEVSNSYDIVHEGIESMKVFCKPDKCYSESDIFRMARAMTKAILWASRNNDKSLCIQIMESVF